MTIDSKTTKSRVPKKRVAHSAKRPKVASDRYRLRFSFWLNMNNLGDEWIADQIERLKNTRDFTRVIRDGIMLISELMEGKVDMLYHLFPDIKPKPAPPPAPPPEVDELKQRITILEHEVDLLRGILINQNLPAAIDNAVKMAAPVHTPRAQVYKPPSTPGSTTLTASAPVVEVDTSSAFLDAF